MAASSSAGNTMVSIETATDAFADPPEKSIWIAATAGRLDCIAAHLASGIAPDAADDSGFTPLHAASSYCHAEALRALLTAQAATGRGVDICDEDGDTPLHACESVECGELLLAAGANVLARNSEGKIPLEVAREDDRVEMAVWLLSKTAEAGGDTSAVLAAAAAEASAAGAAGAAADDDDDDEDDDIEDDDGSAGVPAGMTPTVFPDP